ncbi:MAG: glutaredoxin family protein [Granulosicoccus sp.]|nr:glutaredoxin family protein [Granulosicoccus sp.]
MRQSLEELAAGSEYRLERVDIDQNPSLQSRFNELVPVLMHGDREICHHFLDFSAVQTVLASYNSKGRGFSDGHHR